MWAVVAVAGANLTTQILKYQFLWRPDFNITERWDNANTLPSGHTTMAASAAVALILLSGRRWRPLSAWAGGLFTVAMGYSTLVCQWHRPSDVLAGIFVPVAWGALAVAGGAWRAPWSLREGTGEESSGEVPELTTVGTIPVTAAGPRLFHNHRLLEHLAAAGLPVPSNTIDTISMQTFLQVLRAGPMIGMLPEATGRDSGGAPAPFGGSSVRTS